MNKKIVTFGELLLRFSKPDHLRLTQGDMFTSKYGGSEANVAVSLAMLGDEVEYVTRLPETPVGRAGVMCLEQLGVDCKHVLYGGRRIGTYYFEPSAGMRAAKVIYDRDGSAYSELSPGMIPWREILRDAFDHGVTHIDLANNYGPPYGSAEETFGRVMDQDLRPYRDELFISTKAGYDMWPGPYGNWGSRKYLMASLDQSLKRMHLDYVDLFYSHRYDPETPLDETLQTLVDIVRQGKALYVGISNWPLEPLRYGIEYLRRHDVPLLIYQGKLNRLHRQPIDEGILQLCYDSGVGFIAFSPLAQGLLTDRYLQGIPADSRMAKEKFLRHDMLTPELLEQLKAWNSEAQGKGQTLAASALRWILDQQGVTSVLVGASSTEQLATNLRCV